MKKLQSRLICKTELNRIVAIIEPLTKYDSLIDEEIVIQWAIATLNVLNKDYMLCRKFVKELNKQYRDLENAKGKTQ